MTATAKINKDGLYDISMDTYHGQCTEGRSTSSTDLRRIILQSPKHCFAKSSINPDRRPQKTTEAFTLGRAAHHLLLGEASFSSLFTLRPETIDGAAWQGNRTVCKNWIKDQQNAGLTVVTDVQIEAIRGMAKELSSHPLIQGGIMNGQIEKSLVWRDKETGIWLKARPDCIPADSADCADLKTTSEIGYQLDNAITKYRYDMQAGLVKIGLKACLGIDMAEFSFIFVESDEPHSTDVLTLKPKDIEDAEIDIRCALRTMAYCIKTGDWFGPSGTQRDARYANISPLDKARAKARRDFLEQEIRPAQLQAAE